MKRFVKLFEKFSDGMTFIEKMKIFAEASEVPTSVGGIKREGNGAYFFIETKLPGDFQSGTKTFKVIVPFNRSKPHIIVYENNKKVSDDTLEAKGDDEKVIFMNYIEITQLFEDPVIEKIVDKFRTVNSPQDVKKLIKSYF